MGSRVSARKRAKLLIAAVAALALVSAGAPAGADPRPDAAAITSAPYQVVGPKTWADANAVAQTGAAIDSIEHGKIYVTATPAEVLAARVSRAAEAAGVLRLKGFAAVADRPMRLVVQGVGRRVTHHFDRPWKPGEARDGRLVVIGLRGFDRNAVEAALNG